MCVISKRVILRMAVVACAALAVILGLLRLLDHVQGNHDIHFRGRVVDENGAGVQGVVVEAKITSKRRLHIALPWGPTGNHYETLTTATSSDGTFAIDSRGVRVVVGLHRAQGYLMPWELAKHPYHFDFEDNTPDPNPNDPVLYQVRRSSGQGAGRD